MKKNVLFVSSEAVPFIKTGGLADVAGSLPKYFDKERYDVRVMLPKYLCIPEICHAFLYGSGMEKPVCRRVGDGVCRSTLLLHRQ